MDLPAIARYQYTSFAWAPFRYKMTINGHFGTESITGREYYGQCTSKLDQMIKFDHFIIRDFGQKHAHERKCIACPRIRSDAN